MKFAVHTKATETTPETRLIVPNDTDKPAEEFFPEEDHATAALLEALRRGDLPGTFHDYAVTPYDDKGNELARVDKADRDAAASDAQWLMSNDKQCLVAVSTMIASRQLYALVVNELERHLNAIKTTNGENRPPHPVTIDALLQAAGHAAAQPFNELDLFQGLTDILSLSYFCIVVIFDKISNFYRQTKFFSFFRNLFCTFERFFIFAAWLR